MGSELFRIILRRRIGEGQLEAFRRLAEELTARAEAEPDTLAYEWYVSDDGTDSYQVETYPNSAALLLHLSSLKESPPKSPRVAGLTEALVFGSPNAEAREALSAMGPKYFPLLVGCTR